MANRKLTIITAIWIAVMVFSPLRPDPYAQIELGKGKFMFQVAQLAIPYIALAVVMLKIRMNWIKEEWFIKTLPFVMATLLGLDLINNLVQPISSNGSFLTIGFAYLVILNVATRIRPYYSGLMFGVMVSAAAMYIWEALYQFIIYTKADFAIPDNVTFFMSLFFTLPFVIVVIQNWSGKLTTISKYALVIFLATLAVWSLREWATYVTYVDGDWIYDKINYWEYANGRINKIALAFILVGLNYKIKSADY